jgi:hypothetical protein
VTGKVAWRHANGTIRDETPLPIPLKLGVPSLGGPMTGGGLSFMAASLDYYLRAYDTTTGRVLWRARLPAGAQATPMTYRSPASGRQFVVVVAGGHGSLGTSSAIPSSPMPCPKREAHERSACRGWRRWCFARPCRSHPCPARLSSLALPASCPRRSACSWRCRVAKPAGRRWPPPAAMPR